jgi:CSLREA domain-containing protein
VPREEESDEQGLAGRDAIRIPAHGKGETMRSIATPVPAEGRAFPILALLAAIAAASFVGLLVGTEPARASTTFTVTNTADPGNGICNASGCTLREAIDAANDTPGKDAIRFDIGGGGVQIIKPKSELPMIEDAVTIDGYSQPGAKANTLTQGTNAVLKIEISGEDAGPTGGFLIRASNSVVKGLAINRFRGIGLQIGGPAADARDNRVVGNFIGTDPGGTQDLGNNGRGVVIFSEGTSDNTIGGSRPAGRNLISGNQGGGVGIFSRSSDNAVQGNLIGTKKDGRGVLTNAGNGVLIDGGASDNLVGGTLSGTANTIAFNGGDGVTIGHEDEFMVGLDTSTGNSILRNSIFENALGIDLVGGNETGFGTTANDDGDDDEGPNNLQNKPDLTSAENAGGETTVKGDLNSTPDETFKVRFFSNPPTGGAEGKKYIGAKSVTTNANGNDSFSFSPTQKVPKLHGITATATRYSTGDTSEFSTARVVV